MKRKKRFMYYKAITLAFILFLTSTITSCTESKMFHTEIYFGLSNETGPISNEQWNSFKTEALDQKLDCYTEIDCNGYWKDKNGEKFHEQTKLIIYIHDNSLKELSKIDSIISIYKTQFNQESVLTINKEVQADFNVK